jgi:hypothetical protein
MLLVVAFKPYRDKLGYTSIPTYRVSLICRSVCREFIHRRSLRSLYKRGGGDGLGGLGYVGLGGVSGASHVERSNVPGRCPKISTDQYIYLSEELSIKSSLFSD